MTRGMGRRSLALTAAATLTLGGLVFAAPAVAAETTPTPDASSTPAAEKASAPKETEAPKTEVTEDEVAEAAEAAAKADVEIVAVGVNAAGDDLILVTEDSIKAPGSDEAIEAFADELDVTGAEVITTSAPFESYATGDVVGGQGYAMLEETPEGIYAYACSIGFSAFTPEGDPAVISAGHCAFNDAGEKFTDTYLTIPGEEPAVDGEGYGFVEPLEPFGEFGFAQYGGTGNSEGAENDPNSTDIAVIDVVDGWNPKPVVTDWSTAGASLDSLSESTTPIKAVGEPTVGSVSKAGRTTGLTTGQISASDVLDGWAPVGGRWVRGFSSDVGSDHGDSGGAVFQGSTAVGVISGGNDTITWATSLTKALEHTDGYTVALTIDKPKIDAGATAERGSTITGTTSTNAKSVIITRDGGEPTSVDVVDGAFSFKLQNKGDFTYTFTAVNGFSRSATTNWDVTVVPPPVAAPVITSPADGSTVSAPLTSISGTGVAGNTVEVSLGTGNSGSGFPPVTVGEDGTWTIDGLNDTNYGEYTITAQQFRNAEEFSDVVSSTFTLAPAAPAITSIFNGQVFGPTEGPTGLSGTGIEGASIKVALNGTDAANAISALAAESGSYSATVVDGEWSIEFDAALEPGSYTVRAVQSVDGVNSATAAELAFSVSAAAPAPAPGGNGGGSGGAEAPSDGGDGELATTGMDTIVPLTASAGAIALIAAGVMLLVVRRRKLVQD
ncbi:S1 family peptidase [Microbacterium sp. GXF0217]